MVIADDGSPDGTREVGERLAAGNPSVTYVRHPTSRGYGEAIRSGLNASTGDPVVGYRIGPARRTAWSSPRPNNRILRRLFGIRIRDFDCAFRLMHAEVAHGVHPAPGGATRSRSA